MVTISLSNKNPDSQYRQVVIDLDTDKCVLDDKQEVARKQLSSIGFQHPLITERSIPTSDQVFHYEYDDIDGLLHSALYVYSTLLHAENPLSCKFKINPSPVFQCPKSIESLYFSIHSHQSAQESISITQLEDIVAHFNGYKFEFLEGIVIDEEFATKDLPKSIDGELLYKTDLELVELLKTPCDHDRYELRYINPAIGFGVFSREAIKKGENIFFYGGVKKNSNTHDIYDVSYAFDLRLDCLKMFLDAREYGNIARFVNHAPNPGKNNPLLWRKPLLEANVNTTSNYLNGVEIVIFAASRDISKGEQLLVDYGNKFFKSASMSRFKSNGKISIRNIFKNKVQKKVAQIRVMASYGVQKAQQYLLLRMFVIVVSIVVLMGILGIVDRSWFG